MPTASLTSSTFSNYFPARQRHIVFTLCASLQHILQLGMFHQNGTVSPELLGQLWAWTLKLIWRYYRLSQKGTMNAGVDYGAAPACSSVSLLITLDTYTRSVALLGPSDQSRFSFCHLGAGQFVLHSTARQNSLFTFIKECGKVKVYCAPIKKNHKEIRTPASFLTLSPIVAT